MYSKTAIAQDSKGLSIVCCQDFKPFCCAQSLIVIYSLMLNRALTFFPKGVHVLLNEKHLDTYAVGTWPNV